MKENVNIGTVQPAYAVTPPIQGTAMLMLVIGGLYLSQGFVNGLVVGAVPTFLRQGGISIEAVGLSMLVMLPWAFSALWAPYVDRWALPFGSEHRKSWLIPLYGILPLFAVGIGAFLFDMPFFLFMILALIMCLISTTGDISAHGLAAERLGRQKRSWGNSLQIGGQSAGMIIASAGVLIVSGWLGVFGSVACLAALMMIVLVPTLFFKEGIRDLDRVRTSEVPSLRAYIRRADAKWMILLIILADFCRAITTPMQSAMLVDVGFSSQEIGTIRGIFGIVGVAGAAFGAYIVRPFGRGRSMMLSVSAQAAGIFGYAVIIWLDYISLWSFGVMISIEHFAMSMTMVCLYTIIMDGCTKSQAGTDFSIPFCIGNLVVTGSGGISGFIAAQLGYPAHFALCALLGLGSAAMTPFVYKKIIHARKELDL